MRFVAIIIFSIFLACRPQTKLEDERIFKLLPSEKTGIDFSNDLTVSGELNIIEYLYYYNGAGVAVGDINNDGLVDIYFSGNQKHDALYLNMGDFKFQDISKSSGINKDNGWSNGVVMADVNADGFLDIYVCQVGAYKSLKGHNLLYINNGDNTFSEMSGQVGLDFSGFSTQASFFDYDRDGDLDMYLLNHAVHTTRSYRPASTRAEFDPLAGDRLYENKLNEGQFWFEDVTQLAGVFSSSQGYGLGLVTSDINQDGWVDIYVGNDFHEDDYLYINQGDGTFKQVSDQYINHTSRFTMGVDVADINGDNYFDIFSLDMLPKDKEILMKSGGEDDNKVTEVKMKFGYGHQYARNAFQLNNQNNSFSDVALLTDTYATDWSWSVLLQDYDNDGLTDIFITNGIYKRPNDLDYINFLSDINLGLYAKEQQDSIEEELINRMPTLKIPNYMYKNEGKLSFSEVGEDWGLARPSYSNGAVYADLDNDGDLDLVINNLNEKAFVYENKTSGLLPNHYIQFQLNGDSLNRFGVGAKMEIWAGENSWVKEIVTSRGFQSSVPSLLHFGLGSIGKVDSVLLQWPDGSLQKLQNIQADTLIVIAKDPAPQQEMPVYKANTFEKLTLPFLHQENSYNDYDRESLIPEKLSTEGPGVVVADFNGDGLDDLFIGGARDQAGALFLKMASGYTETSNPAFVEDASMEDVESVAFDMDKDGDLDLYIVSGGNDYADGSAFLTDRIYLNDGTGIFIKMDIPLPSTNGGCVAVADYDKDGFDDLFVGSRSVPGAYGLSPFSFLLKNIKGETFQVVKKWQAGMVTDAAWFDYNGDNYEDLVIVGDWMPVTLFENVQGNDLMDKTYELGLGKTNGMWNSIKIADFDQNGTLDMLGGNLGLNSKLKATPEFPVTLYLEDFDKNGQLDPVIFYVNHGENIPLFSKDDLIKQMPYLKKKFLSYKEFSKVRSIEDLTGIKLNDIGETKVLYELRSSLFLNQTNHFESRPLTIEAQMSTIESFEIADFNGDNLPDIAFVGNFFGPVTSIGRYDANAGGILLGSRQGFETSVYPLPIRFDLDYREIKKIGPQTFLVVPNNNQPVILDLNGTASLWESDIL